MVPTSRQRMKIDEITKSLPWNYQVNVSKVDGLAFLRLFRPGRRVQEITIGKRGGVLRDTTRNMDE